MKSSGLDLSSISRPEQRRRDNTAHAGADGVEERDGGRADLDREGLADGEVAGAGRRRGEEEDDRPGDRLGDGVEVALREHPAGDGEQNAGEAIGPADHDAPAPPVEQVTEKERPKEVAERKGQQVPADERRRHAVETAEDQRVGEEDRVVAEGLAGHQAEPDEGPSGIDHDQRARDVEPAAALPGADAHHRRRLRRFDLAAGRAHLRLDILDDGLRLRGAAVGHQPARALGDEAADGDDDQPQHRPDQERRPPADLWRQHARVQHHHRSRRP